MTALSRLNFNLNYCCPRSPSPSISTVATAATTSVIDIPIVSEWLRKFNHAFPKFEQVSNNGIYPLLEKEIQEITSLLQEGRVISNSPARHSGISQMVHGLVNPRILQLQERYTDAQKKLCDSKESKAEDIELAKTWEKLGLPASILEGHADCARFLIESKLAFPIVGYRETSQNPEMHDIKLDRDGHPMIKVQGGYKRWELVKQEFTYDPQTYHIRSRVYPGSITQSWTYLSPQGLVPIDRMNHDRLIPIYQLNAAERQRVVDHARRFYETNREVDQGISKDWVIQFHTSPRRQFVATVSPFPNKPIYDNLVRNLNTHIVMRLIAPNGDVYSIGLEMPADSQQFLWEDGMAKFLGTVTAQVNKAGDYEEFRKHEGRVVTSIPLTNQRAQNILTMLNTLGDVRFHFLRQNCANLAGIVLKASGYDLDMQTTVSEVLYDALPDLKHIPVIGPPAHTIYQCYQKVIGGLCWMTPKPIQNAVAFGEDVLTFLPRKVVTVALNMLIYKFGGSTMLHALPDGVEEDDLFKANRFLNFSRLIRSRSDLVKDEIPEAYHSKYFIDWQKKQNSTFTEAYSGRPKLTIVPPAM